MLKRAGVLEGSFPDGTDGALAAAVIYSPRGLLTRHLFFFLQSKEVHCVGDMPTMVVPQFSLKYRRRPGIKSCVCLKCLISHYSYLPFSCPNLACVPRKANHVLLTYFTR